VHGLQDTRAKDTNALPPPLKLPQMVPPLLVNLTVSTVTSNCVKSHLREELMPTICRETQ